MRVLITGVAGFTGRHLAAELLRAGYEVHGLARNSVEMDGVVVHACGLEDPVELGKVLEQVQPDWVAHLAAISFVAHGEVDAIYQTNLIGSRHLLDALSKCSKKPSSILLASSANVYGNAAEGALDEQTLPAPANDYAVSKLAMEYMAALYKDRLPIIVVRPFNYTGVGQAENFLLPKIINHVRRKAPLIELGNLHVARDFSDVRRVVLFYRRLLETPSAISQTFNVSSGKGYTLEEVLEKVRRISGHDFEVRVNPAFVRANEVKVLIGNSARLEALLPGVPEIPLDDTLRWMLEESVVDA